MGFISGIAGKMLGGAGQAASAVGFEQFKQDALSARDATLNEYRKAEQTRGFEHAETMQGKQQEFVRGERVEGEKFQAGEKDKDRTLTENMSIDKLALEESLGLKRIAVDQYRNEIAKGELKLRGAALANDSARLALEKQVKDIQVAAARLDLDEKKRFDSLKTKYLDPNTSDKEREVIGDSIYTLLGKDKFQPVTGKDADGNTQFVGGFNTRTGKMAGGQASGSGVDWAQFVGGKQGDKAPAASPAKREGGVVSRARSEPIVQNSAFSSAAQRAEKEYGRPDEQLGGLLNALDTPNLSTDQKSHLSLQLQARLRELGIMGQ